MFLRGTVLMAAAVLIAPSLAHAQRTSLADRVAALEVRAANDQSGTDLVNQITQLRQEVQDLRGQLELLRQQLDTFKQSQRAQYLDLSGRLDRLEGGGSVTAGKLEPAPSQAAPPVAVESQPGFPLQPPSATASGDEQSAYQAAFDVLKSGNYVAAARQLRSFLDTYPSGQLAANALYWLGESYYVTQNYALAVEQFKTLLDRYPTHDKAPGAMLKLGLSQYGLRQNDAAIATLQQVGRRYPGTDVARIAEERLRSIQFTGNR